MPRARIVLLALASLIALPLLLGAGATSSLEQHLRNLGIFDTAVADLAKGGFMSSKEAARKLGTTGFVTAVVHTKNVDANLDNRAALEVEETVALLIITAQRTSILDGTWVVNDLLQGKITIYQDLGELRRQCASSDPDTFGCNIRGGGGKGIYLYGYPNEPVAVRMEKHRGELIHELLHNRQGAATGHPDMPSQNGGKKPFQTVVDENAACYDSVATIMYKGKVPYPTKDLTLCKSSRRK